MLLLLPPAKRLFLPYRVGCNFKNDVDYMDRFVPLIVQDRDYCCNPSKGEHCVKQNGLSALLNKEISLN